MTLAGAPPSSSWRVLNSLTLTCISLGRWRKPIDLILTPTGTVLKPPFFEHHLGPSTREGECDVSHSRRR